MRLARVILLLGCICSSFFWDIASADVALQNPGFELPPTNWAPNASVPVNENNTIPGWTSSGSVQYVTAPNGHGILLAEDGKINQTYVSNGGTSLFSLNMLTFTLSMGGSTHCANNVSLVVSVPDSEAEFNLQQNYSKDPWQTYAYFLGNWGNGNPIDIVLRSKTVDTGDSNSTTCWPVVDSASLKAVATPPAGENPDNLLSNGGFELGPAFSDGRAGVLLDPEPSVGESALFDWSVIGTVRYIDSKSFFVPQGIAAVEIIAGGSSGIQAAASLTEGSGYKLEFMLGDANDSCLGDFTVGVQAGSSVQNFTFNSKGNGSATTHSMNFKAGTESSPTTISFQSYAARQNEDGVLCGPVIDGVVLRASDGRASGSIGTLPLAILLLISLLQFNIVQ